MQAAAPPLPRLQLSQAESLFVSVGLYVFSNGLVPLLYDFLGGNVSDFDDSNPYKLSSSLAVYLVALGLILYRFDRTKLVSKYSALLLIAFALPLISAMWSVDPLVTMKRAIAYSLTGAFALYIAQSCTPEELLNRLIPVFFVGLVLSFAYSALLPGYGIHHDRLAGAWKGVYGHKNDLGRICALAIIVCYFAHPQTLALKAIRALALPMAFLMLYLAQSKTNWLIVAGFIAMLPILAPLRSKILPPPLRLAVTFSMLGALVLFITSFASTILESVGRTTTLSGRETLWRGVTEIAAADYPIFGAGYGAFFTRAGAIPKLEPYLRYWGIVPNHAHSGYLNVLADLGLIGAMLLAALIVVVIVRLLLLIMRDPKRPVWTAYTCVVFLFLVNNYSETVSFKHSDICWILFCVIYFHIAIEQRARRPHPLPATHPYPAPMHA